MKKLIKLLLVLIISTVALGESSSFGIVLDGDFRSAGVSQENIEKAKQLMVKTSTEFKKLSLDRQQLELEANRLLLDNPEKNLVVLDGIFDKIGKLESSILKSKLRSQLSMYKFITRDQYVKAREIALTRIEGDNSKGKTK